MQPEHSQHRLTGGKRLYSSNWVKCCMYRWLSRRRRHSKYFKGSRQKKNGRRFGTRLEKCFWKENSTSIYCHFKMSGCDCLSVILIAGITHNCVRFEFDSFWWINQKPSITFFRCTSSIDHRTICNVAAVRSLPITNREWNDTFTIVLMASMVHAIQTFTDSILINLLLRRRTDDWTEIIHLNKNWP